jgi:hypothetical protein
MDATNPPRHPKNSKTRKTCKNNVFLGKTTLYNRKTMIARAWSMGIDRHVNFSSPPRHFKNRKTRKTSKN